MIELKTHEQLKPAIDRAVADRQNLLVQLTNFARKYIVVNRRNGQIYEVIFKVDVHGRRFGECDCRAGQLNRICKHLAAAAGLNTCLAEQGLLNRQEVQSTQTQKVEECVNTPQPV